MLRQRATEALNRTLLGENPPPMSLPASDGPTSSLLSEAELARLARVAASPLEAAVRFELSEAAQLPPDAWLL